MTAKRIPVLMYHRIGQAHNDWEKKYCVSPETFACHMHTLADRGFIACSINDFIDWLNGNNTLPAKSILITFDDGFFGVFEHGFPVLQDLNWPAVMFLVSGLLGQRDIWSRNENPSGQTYPLLGPKEVLIMQSHGFSFYSHTRSHADLCLIEDPQLEDELKVSREDLESMLNEPAPYIAYPYGHYNERVLGKVKSAGYKAAFSVQPGFNRPGMDPFRIRRIDVFGTDSSANLVRKVTYGTNDGAWRQAIRYYYRRLYSRVKPGH